MKRFLVVVLVLMVLGTVRADRESPPDSKAVSKARDEIKALYKSEYAKTKPSDLLKLANTLYKQAMETKDDSATVYALLFEAIQLADKGGDPVLVTRLIETITQQFTFESVQMKKTHYPMVEKAVSTATAYRSLANLCLRAADEAVAVDDYDAVTVFLKIAGTSASNSKVSGLLTQVNSKKKEAEGAEDMFKKCQPHIKKLEEDSKDPEANTAVGKYYCFFKGDWEKGLALLAAGKDDKLSALAKKEEASENGDLADVADEWLEVAKKEKDNLQVQRHVYKLYQDALPSLTGFNKTKAEQKIATLEKVPGIQPRFLSLDISKVLNAYSNKPIWNANAANEVFSFEKYGRQVLDKVPYNIIDPKDGKNLMAFHGPGGSLCRGYTDTFKIPCGSPAKKLYLLGGISGWPYPYTKEKRTVVNVKLHFEGGTVEEIPLVDGDHFTGYNPNDEAPKSKQVIKTKDKQVRSIVLNVENSGVITEIEFVKVDHVSAPILFAVTVER